MLKVILICRVENHYVTVAPPLEMSVPMPYAFLSWVDDFLSQITRHFFLLPVTLQCPQLPLAIVNREYHPYPQLVLFLQCAMLQIVVEDPYAVLP